MRLAKRDIVWICFETVMVCLVVWFLVDPPFKRPLIQELGRAASFVVPLLVLQPFCAAWMAFRAFRREKNKLPYVAAILLLPLGWLWYYVERVRRVDLDKNPDVR
jgi:hypothetical protein